MADFTSEHYKHVRRYLNLGKLGSRLTREPQGSGTPDAFDGAIETSGFALASIHARKNGTPWTSGVATMKGGILVEDPQALATPDTITNSTALKRGIDISGDRVIDLATSTAEAGTEIVVDVYLYGRKTT